MEKSKKLKTDKWTLVQHSGFGYSGHPQFERGLEERHVETTAQAERVAKAGGMLFDDYIDASEIAEELMYPPGTLGLIPNAEGTFSDKKIGGLKIFIPAAPE